ncbi:hypothetical protein DYB28_012352 [Aphanomyces astaci]|uniref:Large ribosomal subunit protein eL24-related N-terminal domain-containing protein n=1 Tax=Aphanomyces astaci TaxID=112090 RepID=A0A397B426_APHAT|nr:hypothetical protein DYB36_011576 [Aphanomyces astaci]RHY14702.1 hypothetical protein DYB25_013163 [Aphanomyces astaci]RHZ03572.1 hypothetical protein DYB31_013365 [Aphanomyces astaci]RLO05985.1 hypothetical protein DYB28_012352 [Aphanomyces astaci]
MISRTETCAFSESRIYPGHGIRLVRKDGNAYTLLNSKCKSLFLQRKKPAKIHWTLSWRRMNKKLRVQSTRRRARKTTKIQRAIVGVSVDELKKKRNQKPQLRAAARDAALKYACAPTSEAKDQAKTKKVAAPAGQKKQVIKNAGPKGGKKTGNRGAL